MVLNSLNFCLSGKLLISPSNLNKSLLAGQSILGCRFFPFITLNILCHSLLAYRVGQRNQLITWWEFPYMIFVIFPLILLEFYLCLLIFVSFFSSGFYFKFYFILYFTKLYQFCQISKWIRHRYTCVPHPEPSSLLPPHTIPPGCPSALAPSMITMCTGVFLLGFILPGTLCASWTWLTISFIC